MFICPGYCLNGSKEIEQNPNIFLSPQDVPIFYDNNPLTGLMAFTLITSFPFENRNTQKNIKQLIETSLSRLGDVIHLKDNDMRGFGAGNILLVQMDNVAGWDGQSMPISRLSLSIESPVILDKTGMKTSPMIWSINNFAQGNLESKSENNNFEKAMQKLVGDFIQSYRYVNNVQAKKPVFYIYD